MLKRGFDFLIALTLLIGLSPLLALLALAVRCKLGRPVVFAQTRPGLNGTPFAFYKFRSMSTARNAAGEALPDAARLTSFGELMRKFSLDELPQLVSVLKGDMSLVGPRPLLMQYLDLYNPEQMQRHDVRPGITGWAQVNGRNNVTWDEKFALDLWYVRHMSLVLDCKIMLLTVWKIARGGDINKEGYEGMDYFKGTCTADK